VAALVARDGFDDLDAPIYRLTGAPIPTPYSPILEQAVTPDLDSIVAALRKLLEE
jgi:pyruvate dehydrogenase E1 component beta subunit